MIARTLHIFLRYTTEFNERKQAENTNKNGITNALQYHIAALKSYIKLLLSFLK
jgi:hypothetical protein